MHLYFATARQTYRTNATDQFILKSLEKNSQSIKMREILVLDKEAEHHAHSGQAAAGRVGVHQVLVHDTYGAHLQAQHEGSGGDQSVARAAAQHIQSESASVHHGPWLMITGCSTAMPLKLTLSDRRWGPERNTDACFKVWCTWRYGIGCLRRSRSQQGSRRRTGFLTVWLL